MSYWCAARLQVTNAIAALSRGAGLLHAGMQVRERVMVLLTLLGSERRVSQKISSAKMTHQLSPSSRIVGIIAVLEER